jgi:hypothetical protein
MNGPFGAVLDILKVELSWAKTRGWNPDPHKISQIESAIRILEAAGKVERGAALEAVAHWRHAIASEIEDFDEDDMKAYRQIRALIAAIPDKGEPK